MPSDALPSPPPRRLAWSLLPQDWRDICVTSRQPAFRAKQIWKWIYQDRVDSWEAMTNLPAAWRRELADRLTLSPWSNVEDQRADDGVIKLLLTCHDGEQIETVLIPAPERLTLCVSTQAGCAFGCLFCATGQSGFVRNLDAGEIVGQLMAAARIAPRRITHIVIMGMGEPLSNYDATLRAVRIFNDFDGIGIGARRITLSTCGVVPGILKLAEENLQIELSVSLHAPTDELRSALMPVNQHWPLTELLPACEAYMNRTGRIITFEYTLVAGVNDTPEHAAALIDCIRPIRGRINLIPLSPVAGYNGAPPDPAVCEAFARQLEAGGLNVTLRRSRGGGIDAACGQLRLRSLHARPAPAAIL
jgi:23S rRNA (adenine2503-C2)-methyltransferase